MRRSPPAPHPSSAAPQLKASFTLAQVPGHRAGRREQVVRDKIFICAHVGASAWVKLLVTCVMCNFCRWRNGEWEGGLCGTLSCGVWGMGVVKGGRAKWQKASEACCYSSSGVILPPPGPHGTPSLFWTSWGLAHYLSHRFFLRWRRSHCAGQTDLCLVRAEMQIEKPSCYYYY